MGAGAGAFLLEIFRVSAILDLGTTEQIDLTTVPVRLNLGAGLTRRPEGHLAIDCNPRTNPDVLCRLPIIPFRDETVDAIYSSHFIEHLVDDDVIILMGEMYRVLKPGGTAYIVTPYAFSHAAAQDPTHKSQWVPEKFLYFTPHFFVLQNPFEQRFQVRSWAQTREEVTVVLEKGDEGPCVCPVCAGNGPPETRRSRWSK